MAARWWRHRLQGTSLSWLQETSYSLIDHSLICAFVERWHKENSSFLLPFGEMTVTLDDVSCLLYLPIVGMLMSHEFMTRDDAVDLMVTYLGSDPGDDLVEVTRTRGAHFRFSYLWRIFKERMLQQLVLANEHGVTEEVRTLRDQVVCIYLLYLMGITLFTSKSQTYVDVIYLRYFRDLDVVSSFSCGAATLTHLYSELNSVTHWNCGLVSGYLTLLQV